MYRFFDPPIHSIAFSVDDLGMVPIYDIKEVIKTIPKKVTAVAETSTIKLKVVIRWSFSLAYYFST